MSRSRILAVACFVGLAMSAVAGASLADHGPRVGAPTNRTSESGKVQRWKQSEVTVTIDASVDRLGEGARAAVVSAFSAWKDAPVPSFRFERGEKLGIGTRPDGINAVLVGRIDVAGHQNDIAFTISYSDSQTGEILEADIVINSKYVIRTLDADAETTALAALQQKTGRSLMPDDVTESDALPSVADSCEGSYDVQNAVTHEAGHFLGLGEDREDVRTTMFYRLAPCETHKRAPKAGDTAALQKAYDGSASDPGEVRCSHSLNRGGSSSSAISLATALAALASLVGRRSRKDRRTATQLEVGNGDQHDA